jgi:MFS family permease
VLPVFAVHAAQLPGGVAAWQVGLVLGAYSLTQGLLQLPFGMASDRFGRKPVIVFGLILFALGSMNRKDRQHQKQPEHAQRIQRGERETRP